MDHLYGQLVDKYQTNEYSYDELFHEVITTGRKLSLEEIINSALDVNNPEHHWMTPEHFIEKYYIMLESAYILQSFGEEAIKLEVVKWQKEHENQKPKQLDNEIFKSFTHIPNLDKRDKMRAKSRDFIELEKFLSNEELKGSNVIKDNIAEKFSVDLEHMRRFTGWTWGTCPADDLRWGESWEGTIFNDGKFKHALANKINGKPLVVRPFPEIKVDQDYLNKEDYQIFPSYNGTPITLYTLPFREGWFWGKTNNIDHLNRQSIYSTNYEQYFEEDHNFENIKQMIKNIGKYYAVSGILYGKDLSYISNDFYKNKERFIVTHIEDLSNHKIMPYELTLKFCEQYDVDVIEECELSDDIIKQVGGYMIQIIKDGDLELYHFSNQNIKIDIEKMIVSLIWEQKEDFGDPKFVDFLINKYLREFNAEHINPKTIKDKIMKNGKKPDAEKLINRICNIHLERDKHIDADTWFNREKEMLWMQGLTEVYDESYLKEIFTNWTKNC